MGAIYKLSTPHRAHWRTARRATTYRTRPHMACARRASMRECVGSPTSRRLASARAVRAALESTGGSKALGRRGGCGCEWRLRLRAAAAQLAARTGGEQGASLQLLDPRARGGSHIGRPAPAHARLRRRCRCSWLRVLGSLRLLMLLRLGQLSRQRLAVQPTVGC